MGFPWFLYNAFMQLVLSCMPKEELKVTVFICTFLAIANKHCGRISKSMLVDGLHPINEYGVMTTSNNGTGLTVEQVLIALDQIKERKFILIDEIDNNPDLIRIKINFKFFENYAIQYAKH
jgi:hypothetical protein